MYYSSPLKRKNNFFRRKYLRVPSKDCVTDESSDFLRFKKQDDTGTVILYGKFFITYLFILDLYLSSPLFLNLKSWTQL